MSHRPHLSAQLDNHRDKPLTLVSAPAGYGKSTLISSWLETYENPGAWLSLSKSDGDLRTFISYFIATIHKHFPEACQITQALLNNIDLPPLEALGTSLLNDLDRIKQPFILVLDDYYLIREMAVHMGVRTLQRRLKKDGLTFKRVVDQVRFQISANFLCYSHLKIIDIAHELGYSEQANFTRAFRRFAGITPSEYRLLLLEDRGSAPQTPTQEIS